MTHLSFLRFGFFVLAGLALISPIQAQTSQQNQQKSLIHFTLQTEIAQGGMDFKGVGGVIDGQHDPTLKVPVGANVQITLIDGDGSFHNLAIPAFKIQSNNVTGPQSQVQVSFKANQAGIYDYYCNIPGHRMIGMAGKIMVGTPASIPKSDAMDLSRDPTDIPPPIGKRGPQHLTFVLHTVERLGRLNNGTSYHFWTFNGKVPGPMLRAKVGDTITVELHNDKSSSMNHSIDLHAVSGPGGGAGFMQVPPGQTKSFTFKALHPGLFVYHCATPMVAEHIANGMYGMILIEPRQGLPRVDHEFYVMQGEIYTQQAFGTPGLATEDTQALIQEKPTYIVFNGSVGALTQLHPMKADTHQTIRVYFGVGGPNLTSSFHIVGMILNQTWIGGSLENTPLRGLQTISVPPGSALITTFSTPTPGDYMMVDHALSRVNKGLGGMIEIDGPKNPAIFKSGP